VARVAVVTSAPLFVEGGHLVIARALVGALRAAGHTADLVTTPSNRFGRQGAAYLATWLTDVGVAGDGGRVDQVISLRYPSYAVRHDAHVCWLNHTMREYYDLWDGFAAGLSPQARVKEHLRRTIIHAADSYLFKRHVTKLCAQSRTVQDRLLRWNGVRSEVIYPPAPQRAYRCDGYGDFIFAVSRFAPLKRIDLILNALATDAARNVRCVIAGDGEDRARLEGLARDRDLSARVSFVGHLTDDQLTDHLARCRAVCFVPKSEDYGLVTVEALASRKAVVTCRDSGAPVELIEDGQNGLVVEPDATAVGHALAHLMEDRDYAERLGTTGWNRVKDLTWPSTVARLVIV
jgi:glycosyltransferase involved in cell wall biosynthesis